MFGPRLGVALLERPETAQLFGLLHYVGLWEGVQRCRRVLHSHGRWRCARTHLALHDAHAGMGFLGLRTTVWTVLLHDYADQCWVERCGRSLGAFSYLCYDQGNPLSKYHCSHYEQLANYHRRGLLSNIPTGNCMLFPSVMCVQPSARFDAICIAKLGCYHSIGLRLMIPRKGASRFPGAASERG